MDQGFTNLNEGCPACKQSFVQMNRCGKWWWTCPGCGGSFGEVEKPVKVADPTWPWGVSGKPSAGLGSDLRKLRTDPELLALLKKAAERQIPPAELFEQRVSWCWAEVSTQVTKEQVRELLRSLGYGP